MNHKFLNSDLLTSIITGTATTAALVIIQAQTVVAKSATEIAAIAEATTVKIDNTLGVPGGSGVIIAKEGNTYTVLTANHVVKNPNVNYLIETNTKQEYSATEVKSLEQQTGLDLAILTFDSPEEYSVATIGNSEYAMAGASIDVSGYPLAAEVGAQREHEFTTGTVTSVRESASEGYTMRYQALTRRGMSGGPVFNTSGQLVGIHGQGDVVGSIKNESSSIPEPLKTGFNAAIPIQNFVDSLAVVGLDDSNLIIEKGKPDKEKQVDVEATKNYVEGIELLQQGDIARANEYLIEAAEQNPNNVLAVYYQGLIDYTKRDLDSAIANYDKALAKNPDFPLAYFSRGLAHYRRGNKQQALEDYNSAIRINPADPWSYLNRGIVREDLGDLEGALADYNQAIKIDPGYGKSYHDRGALRYYQRDFKGAIEDFQKASEIFFQEGDDISYNVALDSLNKAERALHNEEARRARQEQIENFDFRQPDRDQNSPDSNYAPNRSDVPTQRNLREL